MKIYMLGGKARSGKDTIALFIKSYYEKQNKKCSILQISEYLKNYAKKVLDWNGSENEKPRQFLQELGNIIRSKKETFFIDRIIEDIEVLSNFCDVIVVSDVRLPLEFISVKEAFKDVVSIRVIRDNFDNNLGNMQKHITEVALDDYKDYDYIIDNNDSINVLEEKVRYILEREVK